MPSQEAALSFPIILRRVGGNNSKENNRKGSSQPSSKLMMNLQRLTKTKDRLMSQVLRMLGHDEEKYDFTWDESTSIIRELATELNRVVQVNTSLLAKVNEDESCQKERQDFIMQWAEDLKHSPLTGQIPAGEEPGDQQLLDSDQKLKEARNVLSAWVRTLKGMEQNSVSPGEEVCSVIQDLESQWKRGKLPNMLPVMDFIIWTVLQEHPYEGPMAKQWLRNKQKFRSKVALNHIPESVWKWILKASAKITLDPSTANPSLLLSPYNKALKMGTIIESVYNPWDHCTITSKMYSGWWCVLGSEGFTSGRHYWEVGVKGKSEWRIGVVKESAPRHGFTNLNTQAGYWTLRLQFAELMAVTTPITKLNQSVPSKVGVYLDIEEGQVSFYDAEKRHHIYTFDANFDKSEKIYPLFHTTETKSELVIL
ncbi:hypothetical protein UPYG_G00159250 [Umbra pygmaea]|uniref:B30.2/SPRY domain-containing protein n=1 Tax=Umbra pygmaea TaxID=75934 RepID=A0ABD0XGY0_UMBPY